MQTRLSSKLVKAAIIFSFGISTTIATTSAFAQTTLDAVYQGLGGKEGINKIVADFLPIVLADDRIKDAFKETDMERLGLMLAEQFCALTGGPCKYSGKDMQEAHKGMNINNAQFNALAEDLQIAMEKNNIPSSVSNKLVAKLAPMQRPIVTK
ncbi:group 1 truncated hemoglobin [Undibacterium sp. RTI2.1]|uniref:group I truncated hemoglobin n=1 Tax=unclassified Undibacterium TaxID=2630295 RepID=UPI002B2357DC|nr:MULTISPECIES: group 1 truncated hemoglobin [unclassified Undibacterium]MEB0032786.1 group 1 truncated hemoglobin [Undibacterium sp. RTI2.1]MEB0118525.1 group 1 truncated hemoglobin [Undibacterium sp. RTI2.2]